MLFVVVIYLQCNICLLFDLANKKNEIYPEKPLLDQIFFTIINIPAHIDYWHLSLPLFHSLRLSLQFSPFSPSLESIQSAHISLSTGLASSSKSLQTTKNQTKDRQRPDKDLCNGLCVICLSQLSLKLIFRKPLKIYIATSAEHG